MAETSGNPLADLKTYKEKERAYRSWDQHRRPAVEFLAPMVLLRSVQRRFSGGEAPQQTEQPPIDAEQTLKTILDPNNIGAKNGANALLHGNELSPTDVRLYSKGVRSQLEQVRNYSRHQDPILKAAMYSKALLVGGLQSLSADISIAWDRIPEKDRRRAFKKITLGKGITWSVKARRLARQTAQRLDKGSYLNIPVLKVESTAPELIKKDK